MWVQVLTCYLSQQWLRNVNMYKSLKYSSACSLVGTKEDERIQVKADNSDNSPWFEGHGEIK